MELNRPSTRREKLRESRERDTRRNTLIWTIAGAAIIIIIAIAAIWSHNDDTVSRAQIGSPISNFTLRDLNGTAHTIGDLKGQVVLINAWATWCPPCRAEMPALHEFYVAYRNQGFTLLAVNAGETASEAGSFINEMGFTFPVLLDPGTNVLVGLGIDAFPTSVLIDRDGTIRKIHVGYYDPADVAADILPLLNQ